LLKVGNTFGDGIGEIGGFVGRKVRQRDGGNERRETRVN